MPLLRMRVLLGATETSKCYAPRLSCTKVFVNCLAGPVISFICLAEMVDHNKYLRVRVEMLRARHFMRGPNSYFFGRDSTCHSLAGAAGQASSSAEKQMPIET